MEMFRILLLPFAELFTIVVTGTVGYWFIGGMRYGWIGCLYMTFITITTICYPVTTIGLTAKHLNPRVRVVTSCNELNNVEKMKTAGADSVISPRFIGGLRMVSEMVRLTVVTFLDTMLRLEEIRLGQSLAGITLSALNLKRFSETLLLAVKTAGNWVYNPRFGYMLPPPAQC